MSDKPYKVIIPGIDGGGSQVFEADSQEELNQKLVDAQTNATQKIRELASANQQYEQQIQQLTPAQQQTQPDGFDKQKFFSDLYERPADAIAYALEKKLGIGLDEFLNDYQQVRAGSQLSVQNAVNAQFAQKHPELLQVPQEDDVHNAQVISKILTDNGWVYNLNNLEAAYAVAKTNSQLKLPNTNFAPEVQLAPAPTTIQRPTGSINTTEAEEEFLRTAPLDKVKTYLEKKYPSSQRV